MQFLSFQAPSHLDQKGIIESGSFYTPRELVEEVERMIAPYIEKQEDVTILDSSAGGGAFTLLMGNQCNYRLADSDEESCRHLSIFADSERVFHTNSLHEVDREKFKIEKDSYLVQVGNPPYNDTTSAYKKGEKGKNECDEDLFDRDLGVSFLRSYAKLNSDLVCVLHPLAYLIKKTNFNRLKEFAQNYQLRDAVIFSSKIFLGTGNAKFPIMIGLYEQSEGKGMDYDSIREFQFRVWERDKHFQLSRYETTDGYIGKYPPRKNDPKESEIGLYYYTFRDINSLKRSASFQAKAHYNAIVVNLENLYQYAYLFAFRTLFTPKEPWLYGNLSPLVNRDFVEKNQSLLVGYAIANHPVFKELDEKILKRIKTHYSVEKISEKEEALLSESINSLV